MSREAKEIEIRHIFKKFTRTADVTIFCHALATYGGTGSFGSQVSQLNAEEFEVFYGDVMSNWGPQADTQGAV